jgi:hypothetical protein
MESGNGTHGRDQQRAQTRSLVAGIHLCRQGRQRGWRSRLRDGPDAQCVDTRWKIVERSVPAERDGSTARDDLTSPFVDQEHLEVGVGGHQCPEVAPGVIAVVVVLRPHAIEEVLGVDQLPQIRSILGRHRAEPRRCIGRLLHICHTPTFFCDRRLDTGDPTRGWNRAILIGHSPSCDSPLRSESLIR